MGIQVSNPISQPAVTFDKVHLTKLEIIQPTFENDAQAPVYQVKVFYRHYGSVNGVRHYANEDVQTISLPDYLAIAMQDAAAGDTTLIDALSSIESAVANIISDQTGDVASVV